ncbi:MAG: F0F1 ATP synthase subunit B [Leuconostoc gelidum]|jgi:F-type H+-transporting ATPase subunit b|uniref:ATP synthase subunit b n=1 Tax=Leuconostoc gelidum subsp. gelidum TaxID=1607839 RepID=A0AB35FWS5_LEUGE|nr:F0F1 ATP synthase subunit B [Leuconostoc gelidum]AFS41128.1 ATP synthase F0 subunit B [Leuconostoc gelidum JB7]MBZ5963966.1 F0F1 ATP synthase subunit B [Leuconostoc gelidum subsp. gelidum]MBZ5974293.1 F0F1 ATP synthase subunit B [Leuconostoc gelidum subsp. gelidum]MBZ5975998.1 F0F1 ATP synthase subunit B [Leuconostoc gelidum subsp. gelidum]MBZ5978808.1 F0F1 ATP synthase subunit B [Leuconostoc gelidum subsp. gelidum]
MFGLTTLAANKLPLGNMLFIIISFLLLMLILKKVAYGPLTKVLDERADKISADIDGAELARQDAEKLAVQRQSELADTRQQATKVVADAKASAQKQSDSLISTASDRATLINKQAQTDAEKLKEDAISNAKNDVAALSVAIASKLMQKELSLNDQQALIDAYISDLETK